VAQLGVLQARGSQSVEPVLAAYRIAARVAWDAILGAWRDHPEATPEAMVVTANYVFTALDQVAAEVTHTYLVAREQHMQRGTRARARLFHSLISDTFDSEFAVQKQALALNLALATGYVALVCKLLLGKSESERGGESLNELASGLDLPARTLAHATDAQTLVVLWPAEGHDSVDRGLVSGPVSAASIQGCAGSRAHTSRRSRRSTSAASCGRKARSTTTTSWCPTWSWPRIRCSPSAMSTTCWGRCWRPTGRAAAPSSRRSMRTCPAVP
jgi:hypothetical protein